MTSVRRMHVVVSGRVQGVFYRATCVRLARERGLSGWVRNRPDGCVEAVFEGPSDEVGAMVAWCRVGPPSARVDGIESWAEPPAGSDGFNVTG
jgi:acylphosphatase